MTDSVEERWMELLTRGEPESREVDAESPLRMLIGVTPVGRPYFAVITIHDPGLPDLPSAIEVTRRRRALDGRWALTLELQVRPLTDAFVSLLGELARKSSAAGTELAALTVFTETLSEWRELLSARMERLSEQAVRGLLAELWFGFRSRAHPHTPSETVKAWVGPLGGAQDFQFLTPSPQFEVKALRPTRTDVEISSAEQLDGDNILLAVVTLEEAGEQLGGGVTLPDLVRAIHLELGWGEDRSEFNRRLTALGVNLDDIWYSERSYRVPQLQVFAVREGFPALVRSKLPEAITHTRYQLDVSQLGNFLIAKTTYPGSGAE